MKNVALYLLFMLSIIINSLPAQSAQRYIQLGPRPFFLVNSLAESQLKKDLKSCVEGPFIQTDFSISHRGAPLQFPEHTRESYEAAGLMGAGIGECDVTFTKDRELVCRHSQCDLHATTNILEIPELAVKCSEPFTPARIDKKSGKLIRPAQAKCCTSDITLKEFLLLKGKMDASNPRASNIEEFMEGTPNWRTDLHAQAATLLTHAQSIELFKSLGMKMTPELKAPDVTMPYQGDYTQGKYAQQLIDEYKKAGIPPQDIFPQSFNRKDIEFWLANEPQYAHQAVYLDGRYRQSGFDVSQPQTWSPSMKELYASGIRIIAPPLWMLLALDENGKIIPSRYTLEAKQAGLNIITWTVERSGPLKNGGGWYYQTIKDVMATVTYYANCKGL